MEEHSSIEEDEYAYNLDMADAWVVSDDTFGHTPYDQRDPRHTPCPPNPRNVYSLERAMHGLNTLQLAHDAPISKPTLDTVLEVLWQSQPYAVRAACRVLPPNGPDLWGLDEQKADLVLGELALGPENDGRNVEFFTRLAFYDRDEERDARPDNRGGPLDKGKGKARPGYDELPLYHVVWPILVVDQYGEDWVTLIWTQKMGRDNTGRFAEIQDFYIIDPRLDTRIYASNFQAYRDRRDRILKRFESLLANLDASCFVTFAQGCLVEDELGTRLNSYWYSPEMPMNEHSSGERCYAVVKHWLWKLTHEIFPQAGNNAATQGDMAVLRVVNPYFERMAMLGICAWVAMGSLSFDARVTIEAFPENHRIPVLVNEREMGLSLSELKGSGEEPMIGRPARQLEHERSQAEEEQAETEFYRERGYVVDRHAAAHGNQTNTTGGATDTAASRKSNQSKASAVTNTPVRKRRATERRMGGMMSPPGTVKLPENTTAHAESPSAAAAQVATRKAPNPQAPASGAKDNITLMTPDPPLPSQLPTPDTRSTAKARARPAPNLLPDISAPPGSKAAEFSDGQPTGPRPPTTFPQMMTPRMELGPDGFVVPLGTSGAPASARPTSTNDQRLPGDMRPRANKRRRSQSPDQESLNPDAVPDVGQISTSPSGGFFSKRAKRGLLSSPTATRAQDPVAAVASGLAAVPAGGNINDAMATTGHATPAQPPKASRKGHGGAARADLDYDEMNRVFENLPGGFGVIGALTNRDRRK